MLFPLHSHSPHSIDIDVEGGSTEYYDSFITRIRTLAEGASKQYYVSAAPQCPYPDAYQSTYVFSLSDGRTY